VLDASIMEGNQETIVLIWLYARSRGNRKYETTVDFNAYKDWRKENILPSPQITQVGLSAQPPETVPLPYTSQSPTAVNGSTLSPTPTTLASTSIAPISGEASTEATTPLAPTEGDALGGGETAAQAAVPATASTAAPDATPYPTSFAHIVELITTGQPIPGIKEIPDTVLEGEKSESTAARRKKPWEKDDGDTPQSVAT
jgi:Family of unknown function (DUF5572)